METVTGYKGGGKKGKTLNMIPMGVAEKDGCLQGHLIHQVKTQLSDPCAAIKDQALTVY
jgi:hypothetical protein